jgi:hypothetical protein
MEKLTPTNELERLLDAGEDCYSPKFLGVLMATELCVWAVPAEPGSDRALSLRVSVADNGDKLVWAFTSAAAFSWFLTDRNVPPQEAIHMAGSDFFEAVGRDHDVTLNIGHEVSPYYPMGSVVRP